MNKPLIVIALTLATLTAFGQGSVTFSNSGGRPVYRTSTGAPIPVGSTFQAALFWAPETTAPSEFDTVAQQLGASANFGPTAGFFSGGGRTINGLTPPGGIALFQVRVWETAYGDSYREVFCSGNPNAEFGASAIFMVDTANPLIGEPNASIGSLIPPFATNLDPSEFCVPEPSTVLLGLCAGMWLLLRCRKL